MTWLPRFAVVALSLILTPAATIMPAHAATRAAPVLSPCVAQLSEDYSNEREGRDLESGVSPDLIAELGRQCRANPGLATSAERDALRCVSRHRLWARQQDADMSEQEVARVTAACRAAARPVLPANAGLAGVARENGNLLAHARTRRFYPSLAPRGSSGLADAAPKGRYQSSTDGSYASTAVNVGNLTFTTLIVDLATDRAILCRERYDGGDRTNATNWSAFYSFDDQPTIERNDRCPTSIWEIAPSTLLNWRQHILKPASAVQGAAIQPLQQAPAAAPQTASGMPSPAAQQCILAKMTAYVRDRDLRGLDSRIPEALSAQFRAQCGVPPEAPAQASIQQPGLLPVPPSPADGRYRFSGHCNGFTLGGRDYHDAGPCPGGVELAVPTTTSNRPQKTRLTLRVPNPRAPVLVLDLVSASQRYGDNDIIEFEFTPVSALPFSWAQPDGLHCTFVKNPADGMVRQFPKIQPGATLTCGLDESRMANIDKMRFGFFTASADIPAFRAALIAAHDRLNPGRPFVSPTPDIRSPRPN